MLNGSVPGMFLSVFLTPLSGRLITYVYPLLLGMIFPFLHSSSIIKKRWLTKIFEYWNQAVSEYNDSENNQEYGKFDHRSFGENLRKTTLRINKYFGDIEFKVLDITQKPQEHSKNKMSFTLIRHSLYYHYPEL